MQKNETAARRAGCVYLIGAGPGDEGLLTVKAHRCLSNADVCIYDNLVNEKIVALCPERCEKIYVGKQAGAHSLPQDGINALIVSNALEGKWVARLKGGDPFIFGRGGEEALACASRGIPFEVVPGITAGVAAAAYAGIPVTHRGLSPMVTFITGHEDPSKSDGLLEWDTIAGRSGTLVFYMGVKNLPHIVRELIDNGKNPATPACIVRWGTYPIQETVSGTLADIAESAERAGVAPPAVLIVGEVVGLRERLRWFDRKPLFGKKIVVTRSRAQASVLSALLKDLGADVTEFPTIAITRIADFSALDNALRTIGSFPLTLFTSVNGVDIFFERLFALHLDARSLHATRICVIGEETGLQCGKYGIVPDIVPQEFSSEGTIDCLKKMNISVKDQAVLLPGSDIARHYIPDELRNMGARVVSIPVYTTSEPEYATGAVEAAFTPPPDLVTFTSSSTAINLSRILNRHGMEGIKPRIRGASIGPHTSQRAKDECIPVVIESPVHSIHGLVAAIETYFRSEEERNGPAA
jgi:uroporphyrinogen III methyltransferase/synthase